MTREGAVESMKRGKTVKHDSFTDDEWVKQTGDVYEFEDGCFCPIDEFWKWRSHPNFDINWSVVE